MYLYGKFFKQKKILMAHDVMAQRYERGASKITAQIVKSGEKFFFNTPNSFIFSFSDKDRNIIKNLYGVDSYVTNFFIDEKIQQLGTPSLDDYFIFFGKWDRNDNLDGMKWFFSNVYDQMSPDTKIYVIGMALPNDYRQEIEKFPNVKYLGFVDNPYEMIANAKAMFAPLFSGAGVKVKVVESLACGTPVIGNEISFEGISDEYRHFMITANTTEDYIQRIAKLDFSLEERVSFRERFLKKYNSQSIISFLERNS
jgi:glycosyltransferase involved in cell wall biosynthesis